MFLSCCKVPYKDGIVFAFINAISLDHTWDFLQTAKSRLKPNEYAILLDRKMTNGIYPMLFDFEKDFFKEEFIKNYLKEHIHFMVFLPLT